uniref:Uncharacterized protein n=1 Tax=Helicotheca tamesis TaxID=374047 RepID=A0A6U0GSX0_9STRA
MKVGLFLSSTMLFFASLANGATVEATKETVDNGRYLLSSEKMAPPPPSEMYKELIYIEKDCRSYALTKINPDQNSTNIGDFQTFKCDLYEAAINFGQYGGDRVGETFWKCKVKALQNFNFGVFIEDFDDVGIWDCTITDILDTDGTSLRNEGVAINIDEPDLDREDVLWKQFHSHQGLFATVGGTGIAKGARGEMEVIWDFYKMTWFHVYTVEVWALEQPMIPLYGSGH